MEGIGEHVVESAALAPMNDVKENDDDTRNSTDTKQKEEILQIIAKMDPNLSDDDDEIDHKSLVNYSQHEDPEIQLAAIKQCKEIVNPYTTCYEISQEMLEAGIIPIFIQYLTQADNQTLQYEATEGLYYTFLCGSYYIVKAVDRGIIHLLIQQLKTPNICWFCVQMLTYIAKVKSEFREMVIESGVVDPMLNILNENASNDLLSKVAYMIFHLTKDIDHKRVSDEIILKVLPALNNLIGNTDEEVLRNTLWAICGLVDNKDYIQMVIDSGILPKVVNLLSIPWEVQEKALDAVFNITYGTDDQVQKVLDCNVLKYFSSLLSNKQKKISNTTVLCLINIIRNESQLQAVIEADLLPFVVEKLNNGTIESRKFAAKLINSIFEVGNEDQIAKLVNFEVIPSLCNLLNSEDNDVIKLVLDSLNNMLGKADQNEMFWLSLVKDCGGDELVKVLKNHTDEEIRNKVINICKRLDK